MTAAKKCAQCGGDVPLDVLWGLCSKCLYEEASRVPVTDGLFSGSDRRFGDYELGEPLGRGGMGVVYEATQLSLHRSVALKMIVDAEAASPTSRRRFTLEAEAAAKLDHPNIVPIYEVGEQDGQPFLSMKLIAGGNLRKKIANGDLCLTSRGGNTSKADIRERSVAIARFMSTISRAVHHAHQQGVLHRDLKPANILVDREGQPHLTDFGLAKLMDLAGDDGAAGPLTVSGTALGTPAYMAPEQAAGRHVSAASDIYSLGAILYEMLAGEPPFKAATLLETLRLVEEQEPAHPSVKNPRIDKDLDTICLKCLEKNPDARYPTAEALAEDLARWLRQEPIHARRASVGLRVRRWVARNRLGTALIVSLCVGLALAIILLQLALAGQREREERLANVRMRFSRSVEEMWSDTERQSVLISSTDLADLANLSSRVADALTMRLTFGLSINQEPLGQAEQYAPFLRSLELQMEKVLQRPLMIDLRLYKAESNAIRDAGRGQLDFQRMGALQYVLSRQTVPGLQPIVRERSIKEAVIFARTDSGVSNLAQVAGKRIAFGQTNSATSFWAKFHFVRAGIRATNFQACSHAQKGLRKSGDPALPEDRDAETESHKQALQNVLLNYADIGQAPRRHFQLARYKRGGLVPLHIYRVTSDVYVARPGIDPDVLNALRASLVSLTNTESKNFLAKLSQNVLIEGFDAVSDSDFDDIRSAQQNEVAEFDRGARYEEYLAKPALSR